ncbi:response regulator [Maricaulis parjimensis]|uniref:response regulator n=1 Tax=Maricaulis parjimensis TaxID=144023 RepID=UPI0030841D36
MDDDPDIRKLLAEYLKRNGYRVSTARDGREMQGALGIAVPDLIVLDVMMPGPDGFQLVRDLRRDATTPVILLTAANDETDRIIGLELGADDYVAKPFNPRELLARIKTVLRRVEMLPPKACPPSGRVRFADWRFDLGRRELVDRDETIVRLSSGEHGLLVAFVTHAGLVLSREQLLDVTRGREAQLFDRSIDNQVSRLRRKIERDPADPRIILTHRGGGYEFAAELDWL